MSNLQQSKVYKSPVKKLARFFEKSRDRWKAKCRAAKAKVKRLTHRVGFLERSRAHWKSRVKELKQELARTQAAEQALAREVEALRQKHLEAPTVSCELEDFERIPSRHHYSLGHIQMFMALVLSAPTSLRGASSALAIIFSSFHLTLACPSWQAGRLWLLRLGYYKLTAPKPHADDWVWILDHTLQLGEEKCLVILGVRLCALPPVGQCLSHADVEPLALLPVRKSNREVVYQQLAETVEKTGVPRAIVSDHGSDLKSGVEQFCQFHPETSTVYDIKHKTASVLKRELQHDDAWLAFTQGATQSKCQLQQTPLAPLAPPNQRTKARYLNVEVLIQWGQDVLTFLEQPSAGRHAEFDPDQVREKLGWVTDFRRPIEEWRDLLAVITTTESLVRQQGLDHGVHHLLEERLRPLAQTPRAQSVRTELLAFVAEEAAKAKPNERLVGSSEVIESVLGKLKRLEQDQAKSGFTSLVLSVCALVSVTTQEVLQQALETIPTKKVVEWCTKNLGPSIQAKRKEAFASHNKPEQKWDQVWGLT